MGENLKHIDELFKQGLGDAQLSPPNGVFEQCMQQLDSTSSLSGGSVASKGVLTWIKSPLVIIGTVAVAGVAAFVAFQSQTESLKVGKSEASNQGKQEEANREVDAEVLDMERVLRTDGQAENKNTTVAETNSGALLAEGKADANGRIVVDGDREVVAKPVIDVEDKNGGLPKIQKFGAQENKPKPCDMPVSGWRPVISENVGGLVTLDLVGHCEQVRVQWGDGEVSMLNGNGDAGNLRVSHAYYVAQPKSFNVKLVNRREVASNLVCADSQRLSITAVPANEVNEVFVPDVFTPNADGANDVFFVEMPRPLQFDITILDSKQRTVFRSNDYLSKWSGMCSGNECKEDSYRVILAYKYSGDKEWRYIRKQIKLIR